MLLNKLECPQCRLAIKPEDINAELAIVTCSTCHSVFGLSGNISNSDSSDFDSEGFKLRPNIAMPEKITSFKNGNDLVIERKWFSAIFVFLLLFSLFWNGFMVVWHVISAFTGEYIMSIFGSLHTFVGLFLGYYALSGLVNKTVIIANRNILKISHKPLPWFGSMKIDSSTIDQIYSKEVTSRSKNGYNVTYEVHGVLKNNSSKKLLKGLTTVEQALFIEQQLEKHLRIKDREVAGEIPR